MYLHRLGFQNYIAAKKPYLSEEHKAGTQAFVCAHQHWLVEDWNIIWIDESLIEIGKNSQQIRVWQRMQKNV